MVATIMHLFVETCLAIKKLLIYWDCYISNGCLCNDSFFQPKSWSNPQTFYYGCIQGLHQSLESKLLLPFQCWPHQFVEIMLNSKIGVWKLIHASNLVGEIKSWFQRIFCNALACVLALLKASVLLPMMERLGEKSNMGCNNWYQVNRPINNATPTHWSCLHLESLLGVCPKFPSVDLIMLLLTVLYSYDTQIDHCAWTVSWLLDLKNKFTARLLDGQQ